MKSGVCLVSGISVIATKYFALFLCPNISAGYQRLFLHIRNNLAFKIFLVNFKQPLFGFIVKIVKSSLSMLVFSLKNVSNKYAPLKTRAK